MPIRDRTTSGVYQIRCIAPGEACGRVYIGSTADCSKRWTAHRSALSSGRHYNHRLQVDWDKYGPDAFAFEVLQIVGDAKTLGRVEREWVKRTRALEPANGYNKRPIPSSTCKRTGFQLNQVDNMVRLAIGLARGKPILDAAIEAGVALRTAYRWVDRGRNGHPQFRALAEVATEAYVQSYRPRNST